MFDSISIGVEEGLKYLPLIIAACVLFRIAHFPDIGIEGTFALGASAMFFASKMSLSGSIGIVFALIVGSLGGLLTGILFVYFHLNNLICGMITAFVSYGFCYTLLGFNSSMPLDICFSENISGIIGLFLSITICIFFSSRYGLVFRFAGESPDLLKKLGSNAKNNLLLLLVVGNAIAGIAGALVTGTTGVANLRISNGKLFLVIMSLVIGEGFLSIFIAFFKNEMIKSFFKFDKLYQFFGKYTAIFSGAGVSYLLLSAIIGSLGYWIIYNVCIGFFAETEFIQNTQGGVEFTQSILGILTAFCLIVANRISKKTRVLPRWTFLGDLQ